MVTAEVAVALPAVVLSLTVGLGAVRLGTDQVRCTDAARAAARAAARGDSTGDAASLARGLGPPGAIVSVRSAGSVVEVDVRGRVPSVLGWLGPLARPSAHAVAAREDVA